MKRENKAPRGHVAQWRGVWIADYWDAAGNRHIERAKSKTGARKILTKRLAEIRAGTFRPSLPLEERGVKISANWTDERRNTYAARMALKNAEPEFRSKALKGLEKANTPERIEARRKTLADTLSDPKVARQRARQLRKTARSPQANAGRSAVLRSFHAQKGLSSAQVLSVLGAAKRANDRDWIMLLLTFWHRLRPDQTIKLAAEDLADGSIAIQSGEHPLVEPLVSHGESLLNERKAVEDWLGAGNRNSRGPLFPTVSRGRLYRLIKLYAHEAALPAGLGHPYVLRNSLEAREEFRGVGAAPSVALSAATAVSKRSRRKRQPKPVADREEMRIFRLVEARLPDGARRRSQITEARWAVARERNLAFDTVREYHRRGLKAQNSNE